jgi:cytochrome b561
MYKILRTLRAVQWAMLASIVLYGVVGELVGPRTSYVNQTLSYIFTSLSVGIVGTIFIVRRTLVTRAQSALSLNSEDGLGLSHWKTGYLATYVLCESLALFGLVLRFQGASLRQSVLYYASGFVLMLFFRPIRPVAASAT